MISLQHVTKVYRNGTTALEDVTVEVEKSEFVFIVGQSGSGKSTFIRLLLKEEEATKGDIYVRGASQREMMTFLNTFRKVGGAFEVDDAGIRFWHRGGPLNATHLMATLSFQRAISGGALGEGAAISIAMVPFLLADKLTERGAGDVWQPDITNVGGFTALKRIGEEARRRGIPIVPHGYKSAITIAANMHFLATEPYDVLQEYALSASPLRWETTRERLPVEEDGTVLVPQGPGLGVTLDPATVERYAVR